MYTWTILNAARHQTRNPLGQTLRAALRWSLARAHLLLWQDQMSPEAKVHLLTHQTLEAARTTQNLQIQDIQLCAHPLYQCSRTARTIWGPSLSDQIDVRAPEKDVQVRSDTVNNSMVNIYPAPSSTWDLQDENCLLSMKSPCSIDVQGYRFFTMERLFYALQLISLGDRKLIGQLAKYSRMDYVRKCVNTRFEMASSTLQNKWLDEQFHTWAQIISARVLSDSAFKNALLDSAGSPLFDPEEPCLCDSAYVSPQTVCTGKNTALAYMDLHPHASHTWACSYLIGPATTAL